LKFLSAFSGHGHYLLAPSYTWDIAGNLSGSTLVFTLLYTGTAAGYFVEGEATIQADGSLTGIAVLNRNQALIWRSVECRAITTGQ